MNGRKFIQQVVWVILITLLLYGCSATAATTVSPADTSTPVPPTPTPLSPTDTPTLVPPTPTPKSPTDTLTPDTPTPTHTLGPLPEYDPDTNLVTFDGEECTTTVPSELLVGEHQFVFRNLSDVDLGYYGLWVCRLIDGHTYQELIDRQPHPGVRVQNPNWCPFPIWQLIEENGPSDKVSIHQLEEVGEHAIFVATWPRTTGTWFCGSFQVVEARSE